MLHSFSIAVFIISIQKTALMHNSMAIHSCRVICKQKPRVIAETAARACIHAFCSDRKNATIPSMAYLKAYILFMLCEFCKV